MKKFRKLLSLVLAMVMVLAMAAPSFAGSGTNAQNNGKIVISNPTDDETYSIYKIFDLESFSFEDGQADGAESGNYAYYITSNSTWFEFVIGTGAAYIELTDERVIEDEEPTIYKYYVKWKGSAGSAEEFAKAALKYAEDNEIASVNVTPTKDGATLVFDGLELGYYLVDSSAGALCSLNTTNLVAEITEKNEAPSVEKKAKEDSSGEWVTTNTAQIGDVVEFQITINAKKGAQGYVLHDEMAAGLTLDASSVAVKVNNVPLVAYDGIKAEYDYTLKITDVSNSKYDFEIVFEQDYLDKITTDTAIIVTYKAILNGNADIYTGEDVNTNKATLSYGESPDTPESKTVTNTFSFDLVKTDESKKLLAGAEFELYASETGNDKISLVAAGENTYRLATEEEKAEAGFISAKILTNATSKITVKGLDANTTYWLDETKAPEGYNKLSGRVEVQIQGVNLSTSMTGTQWVAENGGIQVTNKTGALLPSTGGIGTTIFYAAGIVLMAGAVFFVVRRKRA